MDIRVIDRKTAIEKFGCERKEEKKVNIISISSEKPPVRIKAQGDILFLSFKDEERVCDGGMSIHHAREIVSYMQRLRYPEYPLYVQCEGGVSRSAGVAAALMYVFNGDDMSIFSNGKYVPNMNCYKKVLEAFGTKVEQKVIKEKERINLGAWRINMGLYN